MKKNPPNQKQQKNPPKQQNPILGVRQRDQESVERAPDSQSWNKSNKTK